MEKKTIEQMRNAVLTFCDELDKEGIRLRMMHKGFTQIQKIGGVWAVTIGAKIHFLYDSFEGWEFMYSALGLSERDAIADYKRSLQSDLNSMTAIVSSVKEGTEPDYVHVSKLKAERTRNAALVAELEKIKEEHGYRYTYGDGFGNVVEKRINSVGVAVDKALTANTEKGGAND